MFKYQPFTRKQLQLLTWWQPQSPHSTCDGIIAEGAIRSGKSLIMSLSYVFWAMETFVSCNFGMSGKSIGSLRRNVINMLKLLLRLRGYKVRDLKGDSCLIVSYKGRTNTFYMFGGLDERSCEYVQGFTAAGFYFDEVALQPESFVNQSIGRCSVEGAKLWFNCNPNGPKHWFKVEHIDKLITKNYCRLHFTLDDNPSLSEKTKLRYRTMFTGVFYQRFVLGLWVMADGVIYDCWDASKNTYDKLPAYVEEDYKKYYGSDYGTINPQVFLEIQKENTTVEGQTFPIIYVTKEYYYDSKTRYKQQSDEEYVQDFSKFADASKLQYIAIDPSAASLISALRKSGYRVKQADNEVMLGIRLVYTLMSMGLIKINKNTCPYLLSEIASYRWNEKKAAMLGKEIPIKEFDHCLDALRYIIMDLVKPYEVYRLLKKNS